MTDKRKSVPPTEGEWRAFARKNLIRAFVQAAIAEALHRRSRVIPNPG